MSSIVVKEQITTKELSVLNARYKAMEFIVSKIKIDESKDVRGMSKLMLDAISNGLIAMNSYIKHYGKNADYNECMKDFAVLDNLLTILNKRLKG